MNEIRQLNFFISGVTADWANGCSSYIQRKWQQGRLKWATADAYFGKIMLSPIFFPTVPDQRITFKMSSDIRILLK